MSRLMTPCDGHIASEARRRVELRERAAEGPTHRKRRAPSGVRRHRRLCIHGHR
jgi:hypothetical protein